MAGPGVDREVKRPSFVVSAFGGWSNRKGRNDLGESSDPFNSRSDYS